MPLLKNLLAVVEELFGRRRPKRSSSRRKKTVRKVKSAGRKKASPRRKKVQSPSKAFLKKNPRKTLTAKRGRQKDRARMASASSGQGRIPREAGAAIPSSVHDDGVPIGEITHYFAKIMVCVVRVTRGMLRKGDSIEIRGGYADFVQRVESMQVESVDVAAARKGQLVGLKVQQPVSPGSVVYKLSGH